MIVHEAILLSLHAYVVTVTPLVVLSVGVQERVKAGAKVPLTLWPIVIFSTGKPRSKNVVPAGVSMVSLTTEICPDVVVALLQLLE